MSEKDVIKETRPRMETVIDDFRRRLAAIRTGRAAVSLLDTVMVDYYGTATPLNQMASVHAPEPQMLTVQPWDQTHGVGAEQRLQGSGAQPERVAVDEQHRGELVGAPACPHQHGGDRKPCSVRSR